MFTKARLKLTLWYLIIIMAVSLMFSLVIYRQMTNEIIRLEHRQKARLEQRLRERVKIFNDSPLPPPFFDDPELAKEMRQRIILTLGIINAGILILAGGLGYILAGQTLRPIQKMLDEQNRFVSDASHELKTPLTSLKSTFEVFLRDKRQTLKEANVLISESVLEVNKLQQLSENLLQLAQYQNFNHQKFFSQLSLNEIINQAIYKIQPLAKEKQILIIKKTSDVVFQGDKESLIQLLVIILDNAIKYSPPKTKIKISLTKTDGWLLLTVEDQGIGIDQKDLPYIFDRFYRADRARSKTAASGYGLGLSIAKKITDTYNGTITVKSKLNKGSTFIIRLPISQSS